MNQATLSRKSPENGVQERKEMSCKELHYDFLRLSSKSQHPPTHTHTHNNTSKRLDQVTHSSLSWSSHQLK